MDDWMDQAVDDLSKVTLMNSISALEAENKRLREALKEVVAVADRDTKEFKNAKDLLLSFANEQTSGDAVTDARGG